MIYVMDLIFDDPQYSTNESNKSRYCNRLNSAWKVPENLMSEYDFNLKFSRYLYVRLGKGLVSQSIVKSVQPWLISSIKLLRHIFR